MAVLKILLEEKNNDIRLIEKIFEYIEENQLEIYDIFSFYLYSELDYNPERIYIVDEGIHFHLISDHVLLNHKEYIEKKFFDLNCFFYDNTISDGNIEHGEFHLNFFKIAIQDLIKVDGSSDYSLDDPYENNTFSINKYSRIKSIIEPQINRFKNNKVYKEIISYIQQKNELDLKLYEVAGISSVEEILEEFKSYTSINTDVYSFLFLDNELEFNNDIHSLLMKDLKNKGIKNIPDNLLVVRLLYLEDSDDINLYKHRHWTYNPSLLKIQSFRSSIGFFTRVDKDSEYEKDVYVLIADIPKKSIDMVSTISHRSEYGDEEEITLHKNRSIKELSNKVYVCKYNNFNDKEPLKSKNMREL